MSKNYAEKLRDPRWQKKRLEIFERDNWTCQSCYAKDKTLNVHHRTYHPNHDPWEYENEDLVTLCEDCHEEERAVWDNAASSLIEQLKRKFLSSHLTSLSVGIYDIELQDNADVVASAYGFALSHPDMQRYIIKKYHQHIKNNNAKRK